MKTCAMLLSVWLICCITNLQAYPLLKRDYVNSGLKVITHIQITICSGNVVGVYRETDYQNTTIELRKFAGRVLEWKVIPTFNAKIKIKFEQHFPCAFSNNSNEWVLEGEGEEAVMYVPITGMDYSFCPPLRTKYIMKLEDVTPNE